MDLSGMEGMDINQVREEMARRHRIWCIEQFFFWVGVVTVIGVIGMLLGLDK